MVSFCIIENSLFWGEFEEHRPHLFCCTGYLLTGLDLTACKYLNVTTKGKIGRWEREKKMCRSASSWLMKTSNETRFQPTLALNLQQYCFLKHRPQSLPYCLICGKEEFQRRRRRKSLCINILKRWVRFIFQFMRFYYKGTCDGE